MKLTMNNDNTATILKADNEYLFIRNDIKINVTDIKINVTKNKKSKTFKLSFDEIKKQKVVAAVVTVTGPVVGIRKGLLHGILDFIIFDPIEKKIFFDEKQQNSDIALKSDILEDKNPNYEIKDHKYTYYD